MPQKVCLECRARPAVYRGRCFSCSTQRERSIQRTGRRTYHSKAWQILRRRVLFEEPMCRMCVAQGEQHLAAEVDHINGDPKDNRRVNLQPLCAHHHGRKTRAERVVRAT